MQKRKTRKKAEVKNIFSVQKVKAHLGKDDKISSSALNKFADDMLRFYVEGSKQTQITTFHLSHGIVASKYKSWLKKSKKLKDIHEYVMELLGNRRQQMLHNSSPNNFIITQYLYDKEWCEAEERADNRKKDVNKSEVHERFEGQVNFLDYGHVKDFEHARDLMFGGKENK